MCLKEYFRIHGDNILECERILETISESIGSKICLVDSPFHNPVYLLKTSPDKKLYFRLFPGYDRFGVSIRSEFTKLGAPIREGSDAIVTRMLGNTEEIIFSVEFCNALPAGNNAWQRTGRAVTSAFLNIPYFHIAEIGGVELGADRKLKAQRFPNPIIPFSYITLGKNYRSLVLPVYLPSPSISAEMRKKFSSVFGSGEYKKLMASLMVGKSDAKIEDKIIKENIELVKILSSNRKTVDTRRGKEWDEFLSFESQTKRLQWLESKNINWKKKSSGKVVVTKSFSDLLKFSKDFNTLSVGAGDIPICLIPGKDREDFAKGLSGIYLKKLNSDFLDWISNKDSSLVLVWITGFKPKGDDSRPDRGLVPLARMLLGPDVDIMTIVSGPAKKETWNEITKCYGKLCIKNGLWEAVLNLSDSLLIDSSTCEQSPVSILLKKQGQKVIGKVEIPPSGQVKKFSEQDVDSVIHFLLSKKYSKNVFECMCNPPGGDWSGLSTFNFDEKIESRWTSLPRVSKTEGKRPDHVVQLSTDEKDIFFSIESKDKPSTFEDLIGERLNRYTKDLLDGNPTATRSSREGWKLFDKPIKTKPKEYYSIGAFCYSKEEELSKVLNEGKFDSVIGIEFVDNGEKVILHVVSKPGRELFLEVLKESSEKFKKRLEIQIH